jgi:hypothetical protein
LWRSTTSELVVYSDAEWAGCSDKRKSTSSYAMFLGDNLVSWFLKRQNIISRSSTEAEYQAVVNSMAEACWLQQLLQDCHTPLTKSTLIYCDNVSTAYLSTNLIQCQRTKHVEIDLHFMQEHVAMGDVHILHVPIISQFVDIFTKCLLTSVFSGFRSSLINHSG